MSWRSISAAIGLVAAALSLVGAQAIRIVKPSIPASGGGGGGTGITFDSGFDGTGTFADGQVVTITRAAGSWGTKPNGSKALYYWPLEANLNPDATYSRNTTNPNAWSAESAFTTVVLAPNAAGSARMDVTCPVIGGGNCVMGPQGGVPFTGAQTYVYTRRYFPSALDPASFNLKFPRFWPVSGINNFYEGHDGASGASGDPRYSTENCPSPPGGESVFGGHGFRQGQWMVDEYEAQQSSASNVRDAEFHHIRNATYAFPRATQRWVTQCTGLTNAQAVVYGEQHSNNVTASPWYVYWDLHVVDDSWCRIMISAESTWNITGAVSTGNAGTERVREWQPVSSWATTSITFLIQRRTLALSGMYLWVIGGTGCTTATRIGQFT